MTNKLFVIINSLKLPKIRELLLYEMKFLVGTKLQLPPEPLTREAIAPRSPFSLSSVLNLLNTPSPEQNSWVRHCRQGTEKLVTRHVKCLSYGGVYVEMQCD